MIAFPREDKSTRHVWLLHVDTFSLMESSYCMLMRVYLFWISYVFSEVMFYSLMHLILFSYTTERKITFIHVRDIASLYSTMDMIKKFYMVLVSPVQVTRGIYSWSTIRVVIEKIWISLKIPSLFTSTCTSLLFMIWEFLFLSLPLKQSF